MNPLALAAVLFALFLGLAPRVVRAQERTAGQVTLAGMIAAQPTRINVVDSTTTPSTVTTVTSTDFGGVAVADLWGVLGPLRLGGTMGVAPMTSADASRARVILPFGASVALSLHTDAHVTFDLRLRGGIWAGATDFGIAADVWASFGVWVGYDLGAKAIAYLGLDVWVLRGKTNNERDVTLTTYDPLFFVAPGLSISWLP